MRKRMTSLLLTLVMLLSLVPAMGVTASAAEPEWMTVNSFEELHTAVNNKQKNIKLGRDIDTSSLHDGLAMNTSDLLTFENQDFVLDLNGKTLHLEMKIANPCFIQVVRGSLTIQDSSTAKTGAITGLFGAVKGGWIDHMIFVGKEGSLTLEGGTFSVKGIPFSDVLNAVCCIYSSVTIKDGVKLIQPEYLGHCNNNIGDLKGQGYALYTEGNCKVIIDGGEFDGYVNLSGYQDTNGSVQINGGTFKQGVQVRYTAEENNSDPAVTVSDGTFEGDVYLQYWPWKESLYMPYRLNGGTFKGTVDLYADGGIYEDNNPTVNPNIVRGLDKCFGYSAVVAPNDTFTGADASTAVLKKKTESGKSYKMSLDGTADNPVKIIPNAWGMMESVTLDGKQPIDYAKDWNGTAVVIKNNEDHTITFKWKDLADKLKAEGYRYDAQCVRYTSGDTTIHADQITTGTEYRFTIPKGKDPAVYSFDLRLDLKKGSNPVNTFANVHIVRLVVVEAPVAPPSLTGQVYYTSGIVFGRSISTAASVTPTTATPAYQWQRSTNGGSTWTDIDGANKGSYTPKEADMGANVRIRVVVTAEGYLGEIIGAALKVNKAANNELPNRPEVEAQKDTDGKYTEFKINNFNSDEQEYVYTTSAPTSGNEWPDSGKEIDSSTVTGLTEGETYYIYTRYKGTATHTAGSLVSRDSVKLYNDFALNRVLLEGYDSYKTIYIKKGESVTLKVSADPSNANYWNEITFKDEGATTSNIAISNGNIAASTGTATPFPNGHTITITGVSNGSANLRASYPSATSSAYGTWYVVVYDDSTVANALRLENVYTYADITLSENDEADLPTDLPTLLPANSGYHLEWRILKRGTYGATYVTENDNIKLEDGKIKPKAAHAASEKAQLELVAVKDGSTEYKTLPKKSLFYVTVTEAPVIELTGITVAPTKVNLELNATYQLSAVKEPVNAAGSLNWESSNTSVATVDSTGKVTAVAKGEATITVSCNGESASCTVTVAHEHDTDAQPWVYMDPGTHIKTCTAGDETKFEPHNITSWTDKGDGTHTGTCTECSYVKTENHSWVFDHEDAPIFDDAGTRHYKCSCGATKTESIPALTAISAVNVTVTAPVKGAAPGIATTADTTYNVAATDWDPTVSSTFAGGTKYTVKVSLKATDNNRFTNATTFQINSKTATIVTKSGEEAVITLTFDATEGTPAATEYTVTVKDDGNGSASADHATAAAGAEIKLTATPNSGYHFKEWKVVKGGVIIKDNKFTMPADNVEVKAIFEKNSSTGGGGGGGGVTTYAITVKSAKNGDVTASHKTASKGTAVTLTVDPDKGYVLDTLTVLDGNNKDLKLTEKNGKFTFTMPASKVTVAATFKASAPTGKNPFIDVPAGSYYEDAVVWAVEKGITSGTSAVTFDPNGNCTRAQAVTFLWRAAGSPAPKTKVMPFTDVPSGSYYYDAVLWAMEQGITKGTSDTAFSPNASCTRAQIVTFLWRANGSPAVSGNSAFTDVASDAYYAAAVAWAEKNDVTGGIGGGLFGSNNNCTRAQIVTFLYRAMK